MRKSAIGAGAAAAVLTLFALGRLLSPPDSDRDGVSDEVDRCPGTPPGRNVDGEGCCSAARSLARAIEALSRESSLNVGEVWTLQKLLDVYPDEELRGVVDRAIDQLFAHRSARLINAGAEPFLLPENPGRGIVRLSNFVLAPVGKPKSRAIEFITRFVSSDETGYVLTHQFVVIEWGRGARLELPEAVLERRGPLLKKVAIEHARDREFNDLFAERATLLLMYDPPAARQAEQWLDVLLEAQLPDGSWVDTRGSMIAYDGQQAPAVHPRGHTTGFAAAALGFYLDRY